jgi:hypothetical protein
MKIDLDDIATHDESEDCVACRAQDLVSFMLVPAVAAWEHANQLPQHALSLHGAAALIGFMIQEGVRREDIERAVGKLVDDMELQIAEDKVFGGPTQGTA